MMISEPETQIFASGCQIVTNILGQPKAGTYIPGETLDSERLRIQIVQRGLAAVLALVAKEGKIAQNAECAQKALGSLIKKEDLRWTLRMLAAESDAADREMRATSQTPSAATEPGKSGAIPRLTEAESERTLPTLGGAVMELAQCLDMWEGKELILSQKCKAMDRKRLMEALSEKLAEKVQLEKQQQHQQLMQQLKPHNKSRRLKKASPEKRPPPIEEEMRKIDALHTLFKRYDQQKKLKIDAVRRETLEKDKKLRLQGLRQREYLHLIRQAEAERRAKEIRMIKKIALGHAVSFPSLRPHE